MDPACYFSTAKHGDDESMTAWPAGRGPEALCVRSARVVVDELVERLRLRVRVLHQPQVLEQHDFAADDGARRSAGAPAPP